MPQPHPCSLVADLGIKIKIHEHWLAKTVGPWHSSQADRYHLSGYTPSEGQPPGFFSIQLVYSGLPEMLLEAPSIRRPQSRPGAKSRKGTCKARIMMKLRLLLLYIMPDISSVKKDRRKRMVKKLIKQGCQFFLTTSVLLTFFIIKMHGVFIHLFTYRSFLIKKRGSFAVIITEISLIFLRSKIRFQQFYLNECFLLFQLKSNILI